MAKFRLGQHVRIVGCFASSYDEVWYANGLGQLMGKETVITSLPQPNWSGRVMLYGVAASKKYGFAEDQLEPTYDGNTKVAWEDCEWQPTELEVTA